MVALVFAGCEPRQPQTPRAAIHGGAPDKYAYLIDAAHADTRRYKTAERTYFLQQTASFEPLRRQLGREIDAYLVEQKQGLRVRIGHRLVYSQLRPGGQYPVYFIEDADIDQSADTSPDILLDLNLLAADHAYYQLGGLTMPDDGSLVVFTEDISGDGEFRLRLRDTSNDQWRGAMIERVGPSVASAGQSLFYTRPREASVYRWSPPYNEPELVFRETDPAFAVTVHDTKRDDLVVIRSESHDTSVLLSVGEQSAPRRLSPRVPGHRYRVAFPPGEQAVVLSNFRDQDFELALAANADAGPGDWRFLLDFERRLLDFEATPTHIVVLARQLMTDQIWLYNRQSETKELIASAAAGESLALASALNAETIRFHRHSLIAPSQQFQYNLVLRTLSRVGSQWVAPFNKDRYGAAIRWIAASDGKQIPVTLIYRKSTDLGTAPLYLRGYGAYGISLPLRFEPAQLALLDRGFVIGLVHIRGGGELGAQWHAAGRLQNKKRGIADFVDATTGLLQQGVGDASRVIAGGASAGGTLMGVLANEFPQLYQGIVAKVPFVDVLGTLNDPEHPLTVADRLEWGDPNNAAVTRYIRSYSPYQNVRRQAYPNMLLMTGARDARVGVHESLKWLAALRENHEGSNLLLIDIDGDSGHLGASDQYKKQQSRTLEYAFILQSIDVKE